MATVKQRTKRPQHISHSQLLDRATNSPSGRNDILNIDSIYGES